ncbi:2,4-dienoyl-CoA reductase-like NADH-dependent reductase (Old Yellow Enzyme family) [Nocardioides luteus]|uniref:NADH:flavin oxidoreductase n=1 Tax=Nocardioides luteus TaxID=1844 RepID=A0ABQ5SZJ0_9ACTN|nr:NADH:flavin oxidoreductase [Nocardioides luteus]MDR7310821.1 2,4-dienoyl-CoA reductase-like NADH-dependent reductase (Old Yellow Enzyme family) [Nocardioides luteus]GGR40430.1 NADH:flavin oxidoreductase [Nocardioides luteus]GLJ69399.1 NADH:flavin oxidoreductase [Nocardioides luteus]
MTDTPDLHPALQSGSLGSIDLGNRLTVAPMTRLSATPAGVPTELMADYYAEFASGGFGLVITEGIYPDAAYSQGYLNQPGLVTQEHVAGWRVVTDRVHAAGARIVAQLMHAGALSQGNPHRTETLAPSAVQPLGTMMRAYGGSGSWPLPREATSDDIAEVVEGFAAAARNAAEAGFDGIEVHAANGYLLDQFVTEYTNLRTDGYGSSTANRIRLTAEVVERLVAEAPEGFLVGVRISQTKVNDVVYRWSGGAEDVVVIAEALAKAGADYIHVASEGRSWFETARLEDGSTVTGLAREVSGLPVIANGGMHDRDQAERVLHDGHADFLSIGHVALANPDLPNRLAAGDELADFDPAMLRPSVTIESSNRWRRAG